MRHHPTEAALVLFVATALGACASAPAAAPLPAPPAGARGVPASPTSVATEEPRITPGRGYTDADVAFLQGMIHHHAQALRMAALVPERTETRSIRMLAERIDVSQRDEIRKMEKWLRDRGEHAPPVGTDHAGHHQQRDATDHAEHHPGTMAHDAMPGMLTADQLASLEAASGRAFDRLFLELMIQHHEGALTMVETLFASPGAGQEPELFGLASEIDSDQRMEIDTMNRVRATLGS